MPDTSKRDLAILAFRDAGHTLQEAAEKFNLSRSYVRVVEAQMRRRLAAIKRLREHPDDLRIMADAGEIQRRVAFALYSAGISRLSDLNGWNIRELSRVPMLGPAGRAAIVDLAHKHGIDLR